MGRLRTNLKPGVTILQCHSGKKGHEKKTELSKYVWELKDKGEDFTIKWSVAAKASPYICGSKRCDLCLTEKLLIAKADPRTLLNKSFVDVLPM